MPKKRKPYRDLGADNVNNRSSDQLQGLLIRRLERLGLQTALECYAAGLMRRGCQFETLEEHLLICHFCIDRLARIEGLSIPA
jgi:hypothetical protein